MMTKALSNAYAKYRSRQPQDARRVLAAGIEADVSRCLAKLAQAHHAACGCLVDGGRFMWMCRPCWRALTDSVATVYVPEVSNPHGVTVPRHVYFRLVGAVRARRALQS